VRRLTGLLGSAVITATLIATPLATPADGAMRSSNHVDQIWIDLRAQSPAVPTAADTLVVSGNLVNSTNETVSQVSVRLRISPTPVRSRAEIPLILAGDAGRSGAVVTDSNVELSAPLPPGAKSPFEISVPVASLGLPAQDAAVFVVGVEALANTPGDGLGPVPVDFVRSFIPWFPVPAAVSPTQVVWLYPLSSAPSLLRDGVFLDDHLASEVAPNGRLGRLLNAAAAHPASVSWVVDPALLEAVQEMTKGYTVQNRQGQKTPGTGQLAANSWLSKLRQLTGSAEVTAIPYAHPDVVALHRAGLDVDIALATTTAAGLPAQILGRGVANGLAWPPDAITDDGTLDVIRAAGSRAIVLSGTQLAPDPGLTYTPSGSVDIATGVSPLRAVVSDTQLSDLVTTVPSSEPSTYPGAVIQGQEFLAELAMSALELPTVSRTLVIAPPVAWAATATASTMIDTISTSEFARSQTLSALLASPPSDLPRTRLDYTTRDINGELTPRYLTEIASARADLALVRSVAPDANADSSASQEAALTRAESAHWRTEPGTGERLLKASQDSIQDVMSKIRILSNAPVTLPGDQGVIPITIANDLDRPARVGVRLSSTPSVRFQADDVPTVTLQPGQKQTLEVTARVAGSGPVLVNIGLLTPEGLAFGEPITTQVRSAAYALAAQWVVIAFFAALVLLMIRGALARRTQERAR
jgi:hypothetical protein